MFKNSVGSRSPLKASWFRAAMVLIQGAIVQAAVFAPAGTEYPAAGVLPGDQIHPVVTMGPTSGLLAWQDHSLGNGWVIRARRLNGSATGLFPPFTVSQSNQGDQTAPRVALLKGGATAFVWRGGPLGQQQVYSRVLKPGAATVGFTTDEDIRVSQSSKGAAFAPSLAALDDGTFLVTWAAEAGDGNHFGVLSQHLDENGGLLGGNQPVTLTFTSNQRDPAVVALPGANYVVAWVSENQRFDQSVDVYSRTFTADGTATSGENRLNSSTNLCSAPALATLPSGGYLVAWVERDPGSTTSTWSVYARAFDASGNSGTASQLVSTDADYPQYSPQLAVAGEVALVTWQDAGIVPNRSTAVGRYLGLDAKPQADSFGLSGTPLLGESSASVVSVDADHFVAVWSGFKSLDLGTEIMVRSFVRSSASATGNTGSTPSASVTATWLNGKVHVRWETSVGGVYQLSTSVDLGTWSTLGLPRTAIGSSDAIDLAPDVATRFFRVTRTQ